MLLANMRKYARFSGLLSRQIYTAAPRLEKNHNLLSDKMRQEVVAVEEETEETTKRRKSLFMKRKLNQSLNQTLSIFRDLDPKYSFLKVRPPIPNIDVQKISNTFWLKFASHTQDKLDLLEAWHLLARQAQREDDEEDSLVKDHLEEQIIVKIISKFPDYTYQQLSDLTFNLEILRSKPQLQRQFTRSLDYNLTKKMETVIMRPDCSAEDIDECLRVSFLLLRAGVESLYREHRLRGGHNTSLLSLLLTRHLAALTAPQLVFSLFLAAVQREFPGCTYQATGQGFPLPPDLYEKLCEVLSDLSLHEVGVLCHSLHQVHLHMETRHAELRQAALRCLVDYPDTLIVRDQFVVGSIAKFLMKRGSENHQHVVRVMEKFSPHLDSIDSLTSIRLLQFILPGKPTAGQSRPFIAALCRSLENRLKDMRLKDLEKLTSALYFLNHEDINRTMREKIANDMLNCNWSDVKSGKSFVFIVTFLTKLGKFDTESMTKILSAANKYKHEMRDLHTDFALSKAIGFLFDLNIPFMREKKMNPTHVLKFVRGNRLLCRNSLFCVLELDCYRELFNINCQPLDVEIRSTLTDFFHSQPDFEFSAEDSVDDDGRISANTFNDETKGFVYRDLVQILKGEQFVWSGHPFPHSTSSIFLIRQDKKGRFKPFPSTFKTFSKTTLESVKEEEDEYTAILVPSKSQFNWNGDFYGPLNTKIQHLEMLGYKTIVILWAEYYKMLKVRKNLNFLRNIIKYRSR